MPKLRARKLRLRLDKCADIQHYIVETYSVNIAFIYGLRCPVTGQIRYIGKAGNPKKRLGVHLASKEQCHRTNWIRQLASKGLKPTLEVIAEVSASTWPFWERSYIHLYRALGFDLVNSTAGGDGTFNPTPETRAKHSAAVSGAKHPLFGKKHSSETLAKQRAAKLGKKCSSQTRERMSAAKNTSGFAGVSWAADRKKWVAYITADSRQLCLGNFSKIEDAVFVRNLAFDKYYGNRN